MKTQKPFVTLKAIFVVMFCQVFFSALYPQEPWTWSTPVAITDSMSNNCRPFMSQPWYLDEFVLVWEKSTDTVSTAIFMKYPGSSGDVFPVLSDSGVHYTNPVIMPMNSNPIHFILFYESDQTGVKNISYLIYDFDGNFSEPYAFFHTPYDDISIDVGSAYNKDLVWTSNGALQYSKYNYLTGAFSEPETISAGQCVNPKVLENFVYWEMNNDTVSQIFWSQLIMDAWTEPVMIAGYNDVRNLSKSDIGFEASFAAIIWSALTDSTWKLIIDDPYFNTNTTELNPENSKPFDPAIAPLVLGVKESSFDGTCVAFPAEADGFMEIFVNPAWDNDFINLSASGTDNRNPVMFMVGSFDTPGVYGIYIYLFWESKRNGHWQLYYSRLLMLIGNVKERISESNMLIVSPNPSAERVTLSYWLDEPADVQIVLTDFSGKTTATIHEGYMNQGLQSTEINLNSLYIRRGIYLVCLITDEKRICSKLVKIR